MKNELVYFQLNDNARFLLGKGWNVPWCLPFLCKNTPHILLLNAAGDIKDRELNTKTGFFYYTFSDKQKLDWVEYSNNSLCFLDFKSLAGFETLKPHEIAELLYFSHTNHTLKLPFYEALKNEYAFFFNQENDLFKLYFRDWLKFFEMLDEYINSAIIDSLNLKKAFREKKRNVVIEPLATNFLIEKIPYLKTGVIFTIKKLAASKVQVIFWEVEKYNNEVNLFSSFQRDESKDVAFSFSYCLKQGKWIEE